MQGKIIKGIAGFYYVFCEDSCLYECKARGVFRSRGITPLVGDNVNISVTDTEAREGSIEDILRLWPMWTGLSFFLHVMIPSRIWD